MNGGEELEGVQIESSERFWLSGTTPRRGGPIAAKGSGHFLEFRKWKAGWIHAAERSLSTGGWPCGLFSVFIVVPV